MAHGLELCCYMGPDIPDRALIGDSDRHVPSVPSDSDTRAPGRGLPARLSLLACAPRRTARPGPGGGRWLGHGALCHAVGPPAAERVT